MEEEGKMGLEGKGEEEEGPEREGNTESEDNAEDLAKKVGLSGNVDMWEISWNKGGNDQENNGG